MKNTEITEPKCIICGSTGKTITMIYQNRSGYVTLCYNHHNKLIHLMNCFMDGKRIFVRTILKDGKEK